MGALLTMVAGDIRRKRTQTAIVFLVAVLASSVSTLAATLLERSYAPWDDQFAAVQGPHLVFHFDAAAVTADQLRATAAVPGVVAAGPPARSARVPLAAGGAKDTVQVIERADPGGSFNRQTLVAGRWPRQAGEIAWARVDAWDSGMHPGLGDRVAVVGRETNFKIVGLVADLTAFGATGSPLRAYVLPGQLDGMMDRDARPAWEMPYRFARYGTKDELAADRVAIEAGLPAGAERGAPSTWLDMRSGANWLVSIIGGVIFAFAVFALLGVTVIVASVVAGAVVSGYRDIGIAKTLGFTPLEVGLGIAGQMTLPALAGAIVGVPLGALMTAPFLAEQSSALNLPASSGLDPRVAAGVPAAMLLLVVAATIPPALRAARTNSVRAIAMGSAPRVAGRSWIAQGLARLGVPVPASLGAGEAFARPLRSLFTVVALVIGIATLTVTFVFPAAIGAIVEDGASWGGAQDANVSRFPGTSDAEAMAALGREASVGRVVAERQVGMAIAGQAEAEPLIGMRGDAPGFGYRAVVGRWFAAPGEAVAASLVAKKLGLHPGDSVTGTVDGRAVNLRVVGVMNDLTTGSHGFRVGWDTLQAAAPGSSPERYLVQARPGADVAAMVKRINAAAPDGLSAAEVGDKQWARSFLAILTAMVGGLSLVLAAVAAAGVFNATLLATRERVRDIATLKSLGMTPIQVGVMAAAASLVLAALAAVFGVPAGIALNAWVIGNMGDLYGFALFNVPISVPQVLIVVVCGFLVALAGAALPARWAVATPAAQVLRSE